MKIKADFTIQKVGNSYVAVAVGETSRHFNGMVKLNETGAFLWKLMADADCSEEALVEALLAEYDVPAEIAKRDVHQVVETLKANGILQ